MFLQNFSVLALLILWAASALADDASEFQVKIYDCEEKKNFAIHKKAKAASAAMNKYFAHLTSKQTGVELLLYKNETDLIPFSVDNEDQFLQEDHVVRGAPLIIIAHGFMSSGESKRARALAAALRNRYNDHNVVIVDWKKAAQPGFKYLCYKEAITSLSAVALPIAYFVNLLVDNGITSLQSVHYIGHSLGAHLGSFVARNIEGGKIGRITGLDPAGPEFQGKTYQKLDASDATFVDVIHTGTSFLGTSQPLGHVDFYPNGGGSQPGCPWPPCSHTRAWEYFTESVKVDSLFVAQFCSSWEDFVDKKCPHEEITLMGYNMPFSTRSGNYFLETRHESPYAKGFQIKENNELHTFRY